MKNKLIKIFEIVKIIFQSMIYKNKKYIIGIPIHGNLGDQAIIYAENKLFNDIFSNCKIIEIESSIVSRFPNLVKRIIKNDDIYIHGGGFLGNLWLSEEEMFRTIIKYCKCNNIIVLPQTIFFTNDDEGNRELIISKNIYESHNKLVFILREKYSFDYMKKYFPKCNIKLAPDMVLYLNKNDFEINENKTDKVLLCLRRDKEKITGSFDKLIKALKKIKLDNIEYTDTVINRKIYKSNRVKELSKKINQFANAKLIITDRLHGMIFALIAGTPCLVFENKSYKIKGVYEWIKTANFVKLHDSNIDYEKEIKELLKSKKEFDNSVLTDRLKNILKF